MWSYSTPFRLPSPRRHSGSPNRHSGASRNLWRTVMFTVTPAPPAVIPAQAGIYPCRLPQPSFRRKPESMAYGHIHHHSDSPSRHPGASRNLWRVVMFTVIPDPLPQPSFRRKPESMAYGHVHRHSGSPPSTVIPAQAGIYGVRSYSPSSRLPRRHPGASRNLWRAVIFTVIPPPPSRHSGASRNLRLPPPPAVIPTQAGIYACRLPQPSFRRKPE